MSKPQWQERHQDYVIGPAQDSRLTTVAAGAQVTNIQFQFDVDAPFLFRGRAMRVSYDSLASHTQVGIQSVGLKYTGPQYDYRMQDYVPQRLLMPYGGQGGAWYRTYPQIYYPAGSTIQLDVENNGSTELSNLTIYLRGVKLFPWGQNPAYTYPAKFRTIPFVYPIQQITAANPYGQIQNLLTTDSRLLQIFQVLPDADFVFRYGQAGPSYAPLPLEVFFTLYDENRKAFSNAPVHYEVLFGPSIGNYTSGGASMTAIGTGNSLPSCFYPEIYVPANHILYYDVSRQDGAYGGTATIPNFPVNLIGSKVYPA